MSTDPLRDVEAEMAEGAATFDENLAALRGILGELRQGGPSIFEEQLAAARRGQR